MVSILSSIFKKYWTIKDLMNIDQGRQTKSLSCKVSLVKTYHELKKETILERFKKFFTRRKDVMNVYYIIFKFSVLSDSGNTSTIFIRTQPDYNNIEFLNNRVQIYCSCKDFMYRSAWVLDQHNSLFRSQKTDMALGTSIQDAPKEKTKTSTLCKHSYAALMYLANNYTSIMKSL